jgi:hypothetical protein
MPCPLQTIGEVFQGLVQVASVGTLVANENVLGTVGSQHQDNRPRNRHASIRNNRYQVGGDCVEVGKQGVKAAQPSEVCDSHATAKLSYCHFPLPFGAAPLLKPFPFCCQKGRPPECDPLPPSFPPALPFEFPLPFWFGLLPLPLPAFWP